MPANVRALRMSLVRCAMLDAMRNVERAAARVDCTSWDVRYCLDVLPSSRTSAWPGHTCQLRRIRCRMRILFPVHLMIPALLAISVLRHRGPGHQVAPRAVETMDEMDVAD
jgi:hypothetical protein